MPPRLATLIYIIFIFGLFWVDRNRKDGPSNGLWIPLAWMFLAGSRYVSSWLHLVGFGSSSMYDVSEGNPIDAASFSFLIISGIIVLLRRKIDWGCLLTRNKLIWLYFLYCAMSLGWSDYPFIGLKRLIKEIGNVVMIAIILTERNPYQAIGVILKRLAFVLLPLSVLFIKYYPDLGRIYDSHFGTAMYTGVGQQKNDLGAICLITGIYFAWNIILNRKEAFKLQGSGSLIDFIMMGMVVWLLYMSRSATSLASLAIAVSLFFVGRMRVMAKKPDRIMVLGVVVVCFYALLEMTVNVSSAIVELLGRDPDLTERVPMWEFLKGMGTDPLVGVGYQSFWLGPRLEEILEGLGVVFNQAHNGYLEQYLNLGYIGVTFIVVIMLSGLSKVRMHLSVDYPSAMLRLCFIVIALFYNYTEASFYGINNIWILTLLGIIEISTPRINREESRVKISEEIGKSSR